MSAIARSTPSWRARCCASGRTIPSFWVQDYHFLALGAELRDLGVTQPIGFFLHTPWPSRAVIGGVPHHRELIEAMLAYDLIGFQTEEDCENFLSYVAGRSRARRA